MYTNQSVQNNERVLVVSMALLFFSEFRLDADDGFPSFVVAVVMVGELPGARQLSSGAEQHRILVVPSAI